MYGIKTIIPFSMIKAVCFDFFNTLAYFDPPRDEYYAETARGLGINVTAEQIAEALPDADTYWRQENFKSPIRERPEKEKFEAYEGYGMRILRNVDPPATAEKALQMLAKAFARGFKFVSFDDALPILKALKAKALIIGVISNIGQEIDAYCIELGFEPYLDFKVTSFEVGYDKPHPEIFELALRRANVSADEAVFIGDQCEQDIKGARGVGIKPILIDRKGNSNSCDCIVIHNLYQVTDYI